MIHYAKVKVGELIAYMPVLDSMEEIDMPMINEPLKDEPIIPMINEPLNEPVSEWWDRDE